MDWLQTTGQLLRRLGSAIGRGWRRLVCGIFNFRRWIYQRRWPDYVVFELTGALQERRPAYPRLYAYLPNFQIPTSLESLQEALHAVAQDPDTKGAILMFKGAQLSLAQAQSLAALFQRFHRWDEAYNELTDGIGAKKVVVYLEQTGVASYLAASAADKVIMPSLTDWSVLGLRAEQTFWKESLGHLGIEIDVIKIAPWKTAYDRFSQSEMSQENREQIERLLDSWYQDVVSAISQGRGLPPDRVKEAIDCAPLSAQQALAAGLVDHVAYEDEIPHILGKPGREAPLARYREARSLLLRRPRQRARKAVGVISLTGAIIPGKSRRLPLPLPLLGEQIAGSLTVQQQVRAALADDRLAAIVLHVDSGGGSSLASDLMWRELALLGRKKPLVVYMGDVAASGGYYVATPAHRIVAQSATVTGSIGVIAAKPVTNGTYEKIDANRYAIQRGANADIYADVHPWHDGQRQKMEEQVDMTYRKFKERVADGRQLAYEELDPICSGKVWTGKEALAHGLVDELGDFQAAFTAACELAGLPRDGTTRVRRVSPRDRLLARSAQSLGIGEWHNPLVELGSLATTLLRRDWERLLGHERVWLIADGLPRIR